jgi:purine-binding chemotaxis protein CheW
MIDNLDFLIEGGHNQLAECRDPEPREGDLHLRFFAISNDEFALPATGIKEVLAVPPDRLTPIPNVSPLLLGTVNVRGRVIWVADLGQLLSQGSSWSPHCLELTVIVIEDQDTLLGLAVDRVVGMDWLNLDELQSPACVSDRMAPFLRGEWVLSEETSSSLRLLDQTAILRSTRWAG